MYGSNLLTADRSYLCYSYLYYSTTTNNIISKVLSRISLLQTIPASSTTYKLHCEFSDFLQQYKKYYIIYNL